jgi:hypothetical protein
MGQSYAEYLEEKGLKKGIKKGIEKGIEKERLASRRETLLRLLSRRFGQLSPGLAKTVQATDDATQLDDWLDRVVTAESLADVGIPTK